MIRAMLAAYRRTLKKTMDQARSMDQVVAEAGLPWLETPDQAVVWGTALGLQNEIEDVLERSLDDQREGRRAAAGAVWLPTWYGTAGGERRVRAATSPERRRSGGLFSSSAVPDFGGMMSALGTIGNSPVVVGRAAAAAGSAAAARAAAAAAPAAASRPATLAPPLAQRPERGDEPVDVVAVRCGARSRPG